LTDEDMYNLVKNITASKGTFCMLIFVISCYR